jgi:hypothetical protein
MEPKVSDGDWAFVRSRDDYNVGDVVAYRNAAVNRVVIHRIVGINNGIFTFKGDANAFTDPQAVRRSQIVGRLSFSVPLLGGMLLWLTTPINAILLVLLGGLLVHDRERLLAVVRPRIVPARADLPVAGPPVDALAELLDATDRVVPIRDMSFPHELAVADVVRPESVLRLADRYDRPVLYDEVNRELYVVESNMLFRCVLEAPAAAAAPGLAVVRDLVPEPVATAPADAEPLPSPAELVVAPEPPPAPTPIAAAARNIRPAENRPQRHRWRDGRQYGGRRRPSPQGRDWVYATGK